MHCAAHGLHELGAHLGPAPVHWCEAQSDPWSVGSQVPPSGTKAMQTGLAAVSGQYPPKQYGSAELQAWRVVG